MRAASERMRRSASVALFCGVRTVAVALLGAACSMAFDGELGVVRCSDEGAYGPPACPVADVCRSGVCQAAGIPLGQPCTEGERCELGAFCLQAETVGREGSAGVCSRACCSSTDCGPATGGAVCWPVPGASGKVCWSAHEVGRAAPGEGTAGAPCDGDGACRSGLCEAGGCVDVCCDDSFCTAGDEVCGARTTGLSPEPTFACGQPAGDDAGQAPCTGDDDCVSGRCLPVGAGLRVCAEPCCSSRACRVVQGPGKAIELACAPSGDGTVQVCTGGLDTGDEQVGAPCERGHDCRSGRCLTPDHGPSYCTDGCCDDASCGDTSAFACRPVPEEGASWSLQCLRR